jgi:hypothetical protein
MGVCSTPNTPGGSVPGIKCSLNGGVQTAKWFGVRLIKHLYTKLYRTVLGIKEEPISPRLLDPLDLREYRSGIAVKADRR